MSVLISFLGITELLYAGTYWNPVYAFSLSELPLGAEDFLLCALFYGGVGSVVYQFVSNQKYVCHPFVRTRSLIPVCIIPFVVGLATYLLLSRATEINIIYTSTCGLFATGLTLAVLRPAYTKVIFANGLLFGVLAVTILALVNALFPGFIEHTWNMQALSGRRLFGVPIEELYFHVAAGACFAVVYECLFHCRPSLKN